MAITSQLSVYLSIALNWYSTMLHAYCFQSNHLTPIAYCVHAYKVLNALDYIFG